MMPLQGDPEPLDIMFRPTQVFSRHWLTVKTDNQVLLSQRKMT